MKNHQLLRCIFPDVLADYFDVVDIQESVSQIDFWLDERNFMEKSDHKLGTVSSYPKFNTHFRLIVTVTVLSSFFLWTLCPTNFYFSEWCMF